VLQDLVSPPGSSATLGGLPILLFVGDFKQFEPIRDTPLWKDHGAKATKDAKHALQIWRQVKDVIFLTEQMTTGRDPSVLRFTVTKRFGCLRAVMTAHFLRARLNRVYVVPRRRRCVQGSRYLLLYQGNALSNVTG
jgi:hypothetical protein